PPVAHARRAARRALARVGAAADPLAAGRRGVEAHARCDRRLLPRLHDRRRRAAPREPAARRGRPFVRPARLEPLPPCAAAGRDPVRRLGPAPRARAGVAVPRRRRATRRVDGPRLDAERLAADGPRRPDPARDRAARAARHAHERDPRAVRAQRAEEVDVMTEARLNEHRSFPAPAAFAAQANVGPEIYAEAEKDPVAFWERAASRLDWAEPWHTAHTWSPPVRGDHGELSVPAAEWFVGGRLNVAYNCVDRHVEAGRGDKVALFFEGEPGDRVAVTYADLQRRVSQAANGLLSLGIGPGDRVVVYLPVLIETVVIALA